MKINFFSERKNKYMGIKVYYNIQATYPSMTGHHPWTTSDLVVWKYFTPPPAVLDVGQNTVPWKKLVGKIIIG